LDNKEDEMDEDIKDLEQNETEKNETDNEIEVKLEIDPEMLKYHSDEEFMEDLLQGARTMLKMWEEDIDLKMTMVYMHIYNLAMKKIKNSELEKPFGVMNMAVKYGLSEPQVFLLVLSSLCIYNGKSCELYAKLEDDKRCFYLTKNLAFYFCHNIWGDDNIGLDMILGKEEFYRLFFEKTKGFEEDMKGIKSPLRIRKDIYEYMFGKSDSLAEGEYISQYYDGFSDIGAIKGRDKELERIRLLDGADAMIAITGDKRSGRKFLVSHSARKACKPVIFVDYKAVRGISDKGDLRDEIERICFKGMLLDAWVCLADQSGTDDGDLDVVKLFVKYADKFKVRFFMTVEYFQGARLLSDSRWVNIELHKPDARGSYDLWNGFLGEYEVQKETVDVSQLAGKYKLCAGDIQNTIRSASYIAKSNGRSAITSGDIAEAVKQHNGKAMGEFAEFLDNSIKRDELVVDENTARQLVYIENRLKYRNLVDGEWGFDEKVKYGKGVCSLFYGPPGTGKTMAARVLANSLGLELYRVDLSRMVSKYIGETQKNISELFDRAKGINALLFFDEADAMFAKRTEVSDSHDRNSNSEVAHLLQKLEEYDGISILASNLKDNIDDAFKRRIKYMVYFPFPDVDTRSILWRKMIPEKAPVDDGLDLDFFAQTFEMSGSEIKDAVLHAAYTAAREQAPIGNNHIIEAIKLSFAKYGKVLKNEDFGYLGL
jgi:hypothetical protein